MNANSALGRSAALAAAAAMLTLLGSCTADRAPLPSHPAASAPIASPARSPAAMPANWQDAPLTPGDWRWSMEGSLSVARFGDGLLVLSCDPSGRAVTLLRGGSGAAAGPIIVSTSTITRTLTGTAGNKGIAVTLPASDSLLDAMAFSRGRFSVETEGFPTLYAPSWPEVSRVTEDCR